MYEHVNWYNNSPKCVGVVKSLTKTMNPYFDIINQFGRVVQTLSDDYWLIEFHTVRDKFSGRKVLWYVHRDDFKFNLSSQDGKTPKMG